jgi:hypothetical protein
MELPLRLVEFTPEPLQLALETANLTLDCLDPVDRRIVCVCRGRHHGQAESGYRGKAAMMATASIHHGLAPFLTIQRTRQARRKG